MILFQHEAAFWNILNVKFIRKPKQIHCRQRGEEKPRIKPFANEVYNIFFDRSKVIYCVSQLSCKNTVTFHQSQLLEVIASG